MVPQVFPFFVAHTLYGFEVNTHSAFVLGFIGAGGMGFIILEFIQQFMYRATGTALILLASIDDGPVRLPVRPEVAV